VIGAGVAGLATGLFLKKVGITATVYESHPPAERAGVGVVLAPNGMNVLAALGLADRVKERGTVALENRFFTESGRRLARYSNGGDRYGQPAVALARAELHRVLLDEVVAQDIDVWHRKRLVAIEESSATRVMASFADGTSARGDLLIGADGVHSLVRAAMFPEAPAPAFVGVVGVGGVVPAAAVPSLTVGDRQSVNLTFGPRGVFGWCGARGGDVLWWSHLGRERPLTQAELADRSRDAVHRAVRDLFGGYHAPIGALLEHTDPPVKANVFDVATLPRWHRGRVVLIGDAAHAIAPSSGQGASLALEDAMTLARSLREGAGDHRRAFETFEHERRPRVARVIAETRRRGGGPPVTRLQSIARTFGRWMGLDLYGAGHQEWMYGYRVDWSGRRATAPPPRNA
jgi:2-polyprenyl-6-methoxyphenol hydroxylase-like FAD-dependent oxidoreductase